MSNGGKIGCAIVLAVVLIIISIFIGPLIFMWGWNYGICAAIGAASHIGYWTAFWICAAFHVIGGFFKPTKAFIKLNTNN